ncbi:MAG TPA: N-acetylmuramoyl-L-alanine amidase [Patescibacteria group bacterium]
MHKNKIKRLVTKLFISVTSLAQMGSIQMISIAPAITPHTLAYETQASNSASTSSTVTFEGQQLRVGLQVGHWHNQEPPSELYWIKRNTGAQDGEFTEFESNYMIAMETKRELETHGLIVDILPAVVPPQYEADVFVTIHADGSPKEETNGFKVAAARKDVTKKAHLLAQSIEEAYGQTTKLRHDHEHITENMTDYYAFAWNRFDHAISKETPGAILETGFVTNEYDRYYIVHNPQVPARGLAKGIINYLEAHA